MSVVLYIRPEDVVWFVDMLRGEASNYARAEAYDYADLIEDQVEANRHGAK